MSHGATGPAEIKMPTGLVSYHFERSSKGGSFATLKVFGVLSGVTGLEYLRAFGFLVRSTVEKENG